MSLSTHQSQDLAEGPVVAQVDRILQRAATLGASDIHVEPYEHEVRVRYRIDGVLHLAGHLRTAQGQAIASRIKVLAALDVAERRRPQDGRLRIDYEGRGIDVRVSVLPTAFGEKVVLRLLDREGIDLNLDALGFESQDLVTFRDAIAAPHGVVLVTGPTGSGKTTTLYAALLEVASESVNVTTVEDPVEYDLPGVNQTRARPDLDFGFAEALRSFLRQDPDVIMVGEIRDSETAQIAVRAALTGHLVFSTLHTNDAPTAPARLADMGVESYLLAASIRMVVAQRLIRRLCSECKQAGRELDGREAAAARALVGEDLSGLFEAVGCDACRGTGYDGREAVYEIMPVGEGLAEAIGQGATAATLRALAAEAGVRSLRDNAAEKLRMGQTSLSEVLRVV